MSRVRFGPFEFDRDTDELWQSGESVRLEPQPARLLATLLARPGELVTREELCEAVWDKSTHVDFEHGLNYAVRQVRTALGETADAAQYIETLRGRGYRFIGTVQAMDAVVGPEPVPVLPTVRLLNSVRVVMLLAIAVIVVAVALSTHRDPSRRQVQPGGDGLGVARFSAADAGDEVADWARALQAEVVAHLTQWNVRPIILLDAEPEQPGAMPNAASPPRWRLDASVREEAGRRRTTVSIVDVRDRTVHWSDTFESAAADNLDNPSDVSRRIALAVRMVVLGPSAGPPAERLPRRPRT